MWRFCCFSAAWQRQRHIFSTGSAFCALKASTPSGRGAVVAWGDVLQGGRTPQGPLGHTADVPTLQAEPVTHGTVNWQTWSEMWNNTNWCQADTEGVSFSSMTYDVFPEVRLCFCVPECSGRVIDVFFSVWQFRFRSAEARRRKTCLLNQRSLCSCQGGPSVSFLFRRDWKVFLTNWTHLSTSAGSARIWSVFPCV